MSNLARTPHAEEARLQARTVQAAIDSGLDPETAQRMAERVRELDEPTGVYPRHLRALDRLIARSEHEPR